MAAIKIKNPKRSSKERNNNSSYEYYAGFSSQFVESCISSYSISEKSIILDPWNGAGTTTYTASKLSISSIGLDLNPAMVIIAKSRTANKEQLNNAICRLKRSKFKFKNNCTENDYLRNWFKPNTASYIRYLSNYIRSDNKLGIANLSVMQCLLFLSLFAVVRNYLSVFIPSNPTWVKKAKSEEEKIEIDPIELKWMIKRFLDGIEVSNELDNDIQTASFECSSSLIIPLQDKSIDFIITSPPYCTRIDYGIATSPELAILFSDSKDVDKIRRSLTGRTTIDASQDWSKSFGKEADTLLSSVKNHSSYSSSNYYFKNLYQYFNDMYCSMGEIARVLKNNGVFICVIQDSFYKDIHCDLPKIFTEIGKEFSMETISRDDFIAMKNMAYIHTKSNKYREKTSATETVLAFKKRI